MLDALVQQLLNTRDVYTKNAAMVHGIPDPPDKVTIEQRSERVETPFAQPPAPAPRDPGTKQNWVVPAALAAAGLLGGAGLTSLLTRPDPPAVVRPADPPAADPGPTKPLLEYLDERGYSTPRQQ